MVELDHRIMTLIALCLVIGALVQRSIVLGRCDEPCDPCERIHTSLGTAADVERVHSRQRETLPMPAEQVVGQAFFSRLRSRCCRTRPSCSRSRFPLCGAWR